ncbi:MAG: hypoxanthine phosphoribosyltransferase [Endomicrobiaceae bacterium]
MKKTDKHKIKILISQEEIKKQVCNLAKRIDRDYKQKDLLVISVLSGSIVFCSDIIRQLKTDFSLDFIRIASYRNKKSTNNIELVSSVKSDITGKDVLIIEDIYDTGRTLSYIKKMFLKKKIKSFKTCVLVNKKTKKQKETDIDYVGFNIEDEFIVGYGLDYNGKYRGLPYIGVL